MADDPGQRNQKYGAVNTTSNSINALVVGPNGDSNPTLQVDSSIVSAVTGLKIQGQVSGGGVTLSVISSATNESLTLVPKGNGTLSISAPYTITSTSATAFAVGPSGTTNATFQVDASETSAATGILVEGFAANSGVNIETQSSQSNENLVIEAKGSGTITLNGTATGLVSFPHGITSTIAIAANAVGLTITQNDTTNNPDAITINQNSNGHSLTINHGASGSTGIGVLVTGASSRSPASNQMLVQITDNISTAAIAALYIGDSNTNSNWGTLYIQSSRVGVAALNMSHTFTSNNTLQTAQTVAATQTITSTVADGEAAGIKLVPTYSAATAQTVTRHNYFDLNDVVLAGTGPAAVTDSAIFRFNAAIGTHKATASTAGGVACVFTANAGPTGAQTAIQGWIKININGTLRYIPCW